MDEFAMPQKTDSVYVWRSLNNLSVNDLEWPSASVMACMSASGIACTKRTCPGRTGSETFR
eukprot:6047161-Heterocapsa_arctica.AAC.1